jgi:hypothetical protein
MIYGSDRWQIAMFDEDTVGRNQAFVVDTGLPAELALEAGNCLIVPFDGCYRVEPLAQFRDFTDDRVRHCKTRLHVHDEQSLFLKNHVAGLRLHKALKHWAADMEYCQLGRLKEALNRSVS